MGPFKTKLPGIFQNSNLNPNFSWCWFSILELSGGSLFRYVKKKSLIEILTKNFLLFGSFLRNIVPTQENYGTQNRL